MSLWNDVELEIPEYLEDIEEIKAYASVLRTVFYNSASDADFMVDCALLNNLVTDNDRWETILGQDWDASILGRDGIKELINQEKRLTAQSLRDAAARESGDDGAEVEYDPETMTVTIRADVKPGRAAFEEKMRELVPCNLVLKTASRSASAARLTDYRRGET